MADDGRFFWNQTSINVLYFLQGFIYWPRRVLSKRSCIGQSETDKAHIEVYDKICWYRSNEHIPNQNSPSIYVADSLMWWPCQQLKNNADTAPNGTQILSRGQNGSHINGKSIRKISSKEKKNWFKIWRLGNTGKPKSVGGSTRKTARKKKKMPKS